MSKQIWMVRAGRSAVHVDDFIESGHVAVAWRELGELSLPLDRDELERRFDERYPRVGKRRRAVHLGQIRRYFNELAVGDPVMTYAPDERLYYLGKITGPVKWVEDSDLPHQRSVEWTHKVPRDALTDAADIAPLKAWR